MSKIEASSSWREPSCGLLDEIQLNKNPYFDPKVAQKLGRGLGAQLILTGSYITVGAKLRLAARIVNVETTEVMGAFESTGNTESVFDVIDELAGKLRNTLIQSQSCQQRRRPGQNQLELLTFSRVLELRDRSDLPRLLSFPASFAMGLRMHVRVLVMLINTGSA